MAGVDEAGRHGFDAGMMINGVWLLVLGLVGIASFLVRMAKRGPQLVLAFVQLPIGGMSVLYGLWDVLSSVLNIALASRAPLFWIVFVAGGFAQLLLGGAVVGGLLLNLMGGPSEPVGRAALRLKVGTVQLVLGVVSLVLGALTLVIAVSSS